MSKSQRTKGADAEREICALLSDAFGQKITRRLGQARDSGHDVDVPGFQIEVKRRRTIALIYPAMAQAIKDAPPSVSPVVAIRADGKEWLMIMKFADWAKLAREEISK